jgi:hypothetical protein
VHSPIPAGPDSAITPPPAYCDRGLLDEYAVVRHRRTRVILDVISIIPLRLAGKALESAPLYGGTAARFRP